MLDRAWLKACAESTPHQPATALWRAIELQVVSQWKAPQGQGLDVGCGDGAMTELLARSWKFWTLVGVDSDSHEVQLASERDLYTRIHTAPAHKIPEPDSTFDYAFSNSVLEHILEIDEALLEINRILKPGAAFLFTVPSPEFHSCLVGPRPWARVFGTNRTAYLRSLDQRLTHLRYWSAKTWADHLKGAGFALSECHPYMTAAEVRRWEVIANWTAGILYSLFGARRRPVEIQRLLGIRRGQYTKAAKALSVFALNVFAIGLPRHDQGAERGPFGCLMIEAQSL